MLLPQEAGFPFGGDGGGMSIMYVNLEIHYSDPHITGTGIGGQVNAKR